MATDVNLNQTDHFKWHEVPQCNIQYILTVKHKEWLYTPGTDGMVTTHNTCTQHTRTSLSGENDGFATALNFSGSIKL